MEITTDNTQKYTVNKPFGQFIKQLRRHHNMSRAFVANKMSLSSQSSIMNFEEGRTSMRLRHIEIFIGLLPISVSVPTFLAMFEAGSITPPCSCVCHYDLGGSIPDIYNDDKGCELCHHAADACQLQNGLWFERLNEEEES